MKRYKLLILTISLFMLVCFIGVNIYKDINCVYGNVVISEQDADDIRKTRRYNDDKLDLFFNDIKIPYSNGYDEYLLPQDKDEAYIGLLTCKGFNISIIDNDKIAKKERMENNLPLKVILYNDDTYKTVYLNLTTVPVIEIYSGEYDKDTDTTYGKFRILDIGKDGEHGTINEKKSDLKYHARGGTSILFPKRSYKLSLTDNNKNNKMRLAGLRKDDDWILNAMFIDETKIREQVAYDILNDLYGYKEENMKYCELIINEEYLGIYNLQIPYDYKFLNLDINNDFLVKIKLYRSNFEERTLFDDSIIDLKEQYLDEFNISQHDKIDYEELIHVLREVVSDLYEEEVPIDYIDNEDININYDMDSSAYYNVLLNLIGAADNDTKNQMLIFEKDGPHTYTLKKHPWDLDYSMGEDFFGTIDDSAIFKDEYIHEDIVNDKNYFNKEKEIYHNIRDEYYNSDYINNIIQKHYGVLVGSGAVERDYKKWKEDYSLFENGIKRINEYLNHRIEVLDQYYNYDND